MRIGLAAHLPTLSLIGKLWRLTYVGPTSASPLLRCKSLIADKGYDSIALRADLKAMSIATFALPMNNRRAVITFNKVLYKQRHKIENMLVSLKDWQPN